MSRNHILLLALTSVALASVTVRADSGVARDKMIEAISASAEGKCAEDILSPMLMDACEQQINQNRRILAPLGEIVQTKYRGMQQFPGGQMAEAYKVEFERGVMTWYASLDSTGRLLILWSNAQVRPK